jgi:Mg-chelatase subunit ChlD/uncharacterized membrane protein
MWLRLTSPGLLLIAGMIWFWWIVRRVPSSSMRPTMLRHVVAGALALAAAGLQVRSGLATMPVMFVLDRSDSMRGADAESLGRISRMTSEMRAGDRAGLVVFGAHAAVERPLGSRVLPSRISADVDSTATNIASALGAARGALPSDGTGRIVLVSDGHETDGDALREAIQTGTGRVPIDVIVPPSSASTPLPVVTRVAAPPVVRIREPFTVTVTAEGPRGADADIVVHTDDGGTSSARVTFGGDGLAITSFAALSTSPGIHAYRASASLVSDISAGDLDTGDAGTVVVATGDPHLLYAGGSPLVPRLLSASGFRVTSIPSGAELPRTLPALADFDAIVLDGIGAPALDDEQSAALNRYADQGAGGVLVLGSPGSLDPGLAEEHPFRKLLPVDLRPRRGRRSPSAALVVVFDKSGSMDDRAGGVQKIEIARQAVRRVLDTLPPTDAVGVIAFDAGAVPVTALATGVDANDLTARLREIRPGGSTALAPALDMARGWLSAQTAAGFERRHVLLVSDGRTSAADISQAETIVGQGAFELTAVAIGRGSDRERLARLAAVTGGRALFPEDARQLPTILAREAARVAGGGTVEEAFTPRPVPHPVLSGLDSVRWPRLGGYVVGAARSSASVALRSHLDDPVLATWQFGLGRVAVYTADLQSTWSAELRRSPTFGPLLVQTARWLARSVRDDSLYATLDEDGDGVRLGLDAWMAGGGYRTLLDVRVTGRSWSGDPFEAALEESSPGHYEARLPLRAPGPYVMTIAAAGRDGQFTARLVRGFYKSATREHRNSGVNTPLLLALTSATGGTLLAAGDSPFTQPRRPEYVEARPWLLGLALAVFSADTLAPALLAIVRARRGRTRVWPREQAT